MVQVKGNGNIVSKTLDVSSFLRLHVAVQGKTELIQSGEEKVELLVDENLLGHISIQNAGRTLFVSTEGKLLSPQFTEVLVRIHFRQIDHLVVRNPGGDLVCKSPIVSTVPLDVKIQSEGATQLDIRAPKMKLLAQAQGDIELSGDCGIVEIKTQSEGNLIARELVCGELLLKNSASGNIEVHATEKISIYNSGSGNVHYFGPAQLMDVRHNGSGELKHIG